MPDGMTNASSPLRGVRVCMATSGHPADDDRIFFKEARTLAKAGADVVVLCARGAKPPARPDGVRFATYEGGGRLKDRAFTVGALEQAIVDRRCDVVHAHEPDSLVAALRAKRRAGGKVIFDSHELWAGVAAVRFPRPLWPMAMAAYRALERRWVARCDGALGATRAISEYLSSLLGPERVATILNVPAVEVFGECGGRDWGEETVLCHDGSLTFERGLRPMAEAVRILSAKHRVVLKIVGDVFGDEKAWLESFIAKHRLEQVVVRTGWLPYEAVGKAISTCHIGLIWFLPSPNHRIAAPNKCFNYLLYGLPVVAPGFPQSHFAVLEREGCARLMDPTSPEACAEALSKMIADRAGTEGMAARSRALSREKYRWEHMEPVLLDLYRRVLE